MAKRQRSISLSLLILRYAVVMSGCMLLSCLVGFIVLTRLQSTGVIYRASVPSQQVERLLASQPQTFVTPDEHFLAEYALFNPEGTMLESNVQGQAQETLIRHLHTDDDSQYYKRYTYGDGSIAVFRLHYRAEFSNPALRRALPPFEYIWMGSLGIALALCLLLNTLWLRRHLAAKLRLFSDVSAKVGAQELDFAMPHAGIKEYDQALMAMEHMRQALYRSLSAQWAAQQKREAEIAALAHDLKTPLTLIGGNAELLLEENLPENSRRMVETIVVSNDRAKRYVLSLLEASVGADETFETADLPAALDELCRSARPLAEAKGVCLQEKNGLLGYASLQKNHWLRAMGNIVQNAIEHTPPGGMVCLEGNMTDSGWQVTVRDDGPGFTPAALRHATERLWRDDAARGDDGHNGLGLWFAAQVAQAHAGRLEMRNGNPGGVVTVSLPL